jgi:subtilisin family serine protease
MDWVRSQRTRRHAGGVRKASLAGLEALEVRKFLAASQGDGTDAVTCPPSDCLSDGNLVQQIQWEGRSVETRVDQWNGRLAVGLQPEVALRALPLAQSDWQTASLGNGYFSLTTPGASRQDVLAWAASTPSILAFEPAIVLRASSLPNDPGFPSQWSLGNTALGGYGQIGADIDATQAWDVTTGSRSVVVGVVDSGIDLDHPDLAANIWTNPGEVAGNGLDDDHNGFVDDVHGWNFNARTNNVQDGYGHGTHVSGIIGAVGNNGQGIAGINWQVSIMPLRFQDNYGVGDTGGAIAALNYATMMRRDYGINIVVTNNSWGGGTGVSAMLQDAIRAQGEAGIMFVAAAGNSGVNCDVSPRYPACYDMPNTISVAATDRYDTLAGFSNYGATTVDLAAPGAGISSTRPNGTYGSMSGSSQAAPHVSGVVALLAAAKPGISVGQIRAAILGSVDPLPSLAGKTVTGGRLNAAAALASLSAQSFAAKARLGSMDPATGAVDSITITFNRAVVSGFDLADLHLTRNGVAVSLENATLTMTDQLTWKLGGLSPLTSQVGSYAVTLSGPAVTAGVGITGPDGESLALFAGTTWTMANRLPAGSIESATPVAVSGWALDPNAGGQPISVQLWVRGRLTATVTAAATRDDLTPAYGSPNHGFAIAMPPLPLGSYLVEVKALDSDTGLYLSLGKRVVNVRAPVGAVEIATTERFAGWAYSSRVGEAPLNVRVVINGRLYGTFMANGTRPDLLPRLGSPNHGYDIRVAPSVFRKGMNLVRIWAIDPLTGKPSLLGTRIVRR